MIIVATSWFTTPALSHSLFSRFAALPPRRTVEDSAVPVALRPPLSFAARIAPRAITIVTTIDATIATGTGSTTSSWASERIIVGAALGPPSSSSSSHTRAMLLLRRTVAAFTARLLAHTTNGTRWRGTNLRTRAAKKMGRSDTLSTFS